MFTVFQMNYENNIGFKSDTIPQRYYNYQENFRRGAC